MPQNRPEPTSGPTPGSPKAGRPRRRGEPGPRNGWLGEPRNAVLIALGAAVLFGGGRRLFRWWLARGAVGRLSEADVSPEAIASVSAFGREGLMDLFRLLDEAPTEPQRRAAGRALAVLWANDEMIGEEEKALVRRGFEVQWRARKRYPRAIVAEIPVRAAYGLPFLVEDGPGVKPSQLEWSHRVVGARRVSLETFSPWRAGPGVAEFTLVPADFETNGPHRLVLQTRVRTVGLTSPWELELPHVPFSFDFDPQLRPDAIFTLPDDARGAAIAGRVTLEPRDETAAESPTFLRLSDALALRNPPELVVNGPLPAELAHAVALEFEGGEGRLGAGWVVGGAQPGVRRYPLAVAHETPAGLVERPGRRRVRAYLTPDADRGWADPDVRSVWPGTVVTDWCEADVVRL